MPITSVSKDPAALTLTVVAEFPVPVQRLWDAYCDPRQLEQFWGPPTYPARFTRHDMYPGGCSEYVMTGPEGDESRGYWEFLDVAPLVDAINRHVLRNREMGEQRRRFVDDASHQLRTPLATLSAQVAYALREPDPVRVRDALQAIRSQLDDTVMRTNQMLTLARADAALYQAKRLGRNCVRFG